MVRNALHFVGVISYSEKACRSVNMAKKDLIDNFCKLQRIQAIDYLSVIFFGDLAGEYALLFVKLNSFLGNTSTGRYCQLKCGTAAMAASSFEYNLVDSCTIRCIRSIHSRYAISKG